MELGTLLKEARMEKGLTLDDIQEQTKIRKKYLKAIENNDFDIIPGNVYVKVFIKGYARQVGIDYSSLIEEYDILKENTENKSALNKKLLPEGEFKYQPIHNKKRPKFLKIIIITFIFIFVAASAFFIYQYFFLSDNIDNAVNNLETDNQYSVSEENDSDNNLQDKENAVETDSKEAEKNDNLNNLNILEPQIDSEENSDSEIENDNAADNLEEIENPSIGLTSKTSNTSETNNTDDTEDSSTNTGDDNIASEQEISLESELTDENIETPISTENNTDSSSLEEEQQVVDADTDTEREKISDFNIIIKASDLAWVRIDIDGENVYSGLLDQGDEREFSPEDKLYIKIGNGAAVTAVIDDTEYGPWGDSGEIAEAEVIIEDGEIAVDNLRD
ncbi:MAG: RodZ domain-containing protein [Bacillota bacterium]